MAYSPILDAEIPIGGPIQNPTLVKIQGNDAYFNTQIASLQSTIQNPEPLEFQIEGNAGPFVAMTGAAYKRIWAAITLTGGFLWIVDAGSSGTMGIDIQLSHSGGSFASIFSTTPTVSYIAGNYAISSNGMLSTTSLVAGDVLRLDISAVQTGNKRSVVTLPFHTT